MAGFGFLASAFWWRKVIGAAFGKGFWGFFAAMIGIGLVCLALRGTDDFLATLEHDLELILSTLPRVMVALSVAALIWVMLPRDEVSALVGRDTGILGLVVATAAGAVTPGGPSSAYALLAMLGAAGAERGALVAYITSWALLGLQRILLWDVPFLGLEFAALRFALCLPLPVIAGLIARRLPLSLDLVLAAAPAAGRRRP